MNLKRLFSGDAYKGTKDYLKIQSRYEIIRTVLLFAVTFSLFAAGWITTGSRKNLLTIVAILGCLPAAKSAVNAIMFCRFKSLEQETADRISQRCGVLTGLFDMVFTGYEKNFMVNHITVKGNTVCGYSNAENFNEQAFYKHVDQLLKADSLKNVNVKIFTNLDKYLERLEQMQELECDEKNTNAIAETLKSICL